MRQTAFTTYHYPLPAGKKYVAVQLLTDEIFYFMVELKAKGSDLFHLVCCYLGLNDDAGIFGLAILYDGEYIYLDHSVKLYKYFPKSWKAPSGTGIGEDGKALGHLYLRIRFYVDSHLLINDKVSRHHYYLQLRQNVSQYNMRISEERAFLMAAYGLQADLGTFQPLNHTGAYFSPQLYFPPWILARIGHEYIIRHLPRMHQDNAGLSRAEAEAGFIREASDPVAPHNLHMYHMTAVPHKKASRVTPVWLGITSQGLHIYTEEALVKKHLSTFLWPDIAKLHFDKRKFEIRSVGCPERKFTYYSGSEEVVRQLLWLCRVTHHHHLATLPRMREIRRLNQDRRSYRESYICDHLDWAKQPVSGSATLPLLVKKSGQGPTGSEQRVSLNSSTSSNTTSGIVSDKVHSQEDSDDEADLSRPSTASQVSTPPKPSPSFSSPDLLEKCPFQPKSGHLYNDTGILDTFSSSSRDTPTSSLVSSMSYPESTHSSSSQVSTQTVRAIPSSLAQPRGVKYSSHSDLSLSEKVISSHPQCCRTKIGVSSLNRPVLVQKLSLYNNSSVSKHLLGSAASEPALNPSCPPAVGIHTRQSQSLDSGICLDMDAKNLVRLGNFYKPDEEGFDNTFGGSDVHMNGQAKVIPLSTAYSSISSLADNDVPSAICTNLNKLDQIEATTRLFANPSNFNSRNGTPDLELEHQLRYWGNRTPDIAHFTSLRHEHSPQTLPPKTVPGCPRERHTDPRRFSCSDSSHLLGRMSSPTSRPLSWHIDSGDLTPQPPPPTIVSSIPKPTALSTILSRDFS